MKAIIRPVVKSELIKELTEDKLLRHTNYANNEIYIFTAHDSPNLMREVGRLRELTFRSAGGGTGKEIDIDHFDTCENPYNQLIVWDPKDKEIVGGYRYFDCSEVVYDENGIANVATSELFKFSDKFKKDYMPYTIELGRSFVQPEYQMKSNSRKGLYALDNLWDGLGAIVVHYPEVKYFFGKVTMYTSYNQYARDLLLFFLQQNFTDHEKLVEPIKPLKIEVEHRHFDQIFTGETYKENYKVLSQEVRNLKENVPPLINAYMNLSPTMKVFGTAINDEFGGVEETGIIITIEDIYQIKKERHLNFRRLGAFIRSKIKRRSKK